MSKRESEDLIAKWLVRALCPRYAVATFRHISVNTTQPAAFRHLLLCWGLGFMADGEFEILGAWMQQRAESDILPDVFLGLELRGVRRIRVLLGATAAAEAPVLPRNVGLLGACQSVVIADTGRVLRESTSLGALRPGIRKAVLAADAFAEDVSRRLRSALQRRGAVEDHDQALAYVASFLLRADRQLEGRSWRSDAAIPHLARVSASAVLADLPAGHLG